MEDKLSNKIKDDLGTFFFRDLEERLEQRHERVEEIIKRGKWGNWRFDLRSKLLIISKALGDGPIQDIYEVALDECNFSAQILDWIAQVSNKTWASREDIGYLVMALDDLLGLQGAFCGGGIETSNGRDDYARRRIDALVEYINRK